MTSREYLLGWSVGGLVVLALGSQIVNWLVVEPFRAKNEQLRQAVDDLSDLRQHDAREKNAPEEWTKRTARTLDADPVQAQLLLRKDIEVLLAAHHLAGRDTSVSSPTVTTNRKNNFTDIAFMVNAKGSLDDITHFLRDFYRRPYLVQISQISLNSGESRPAGKKNQTAKEELTVSLKIQTLVLPNIPGVPSAPLKDLAGIEEKADPSRLAAADMGDYDKIIAQNIFRWPEPPKIASRQPASRPVETNVAVKPPDPEPRRKTKPPPDDKKIVCGATSIYGENVAWVRDENHVSEPPKQYRVNESLDDGTVLLIHPLGVVVKHTEEDGAAKEYFYALGKSFRDRQLLSQAEQPEVWDEWMRLRGESPQ